MKCGLQFVIDDLVRANSIAELAGKQLSVVSYNIVWHLVFTDHVFESHSCQLL